MQDVPQFITRLGLSLRDYLDERRAAVIDAAHCVRINYEAYFFGDEWERERFVSDPTLYCGLLTDPVSRERFRPRRDSPRAVLEGVTYYFRSEADRERFESDPQLYRLPNWKM